MLNHHRTPNWYSEHSVCQPNNGTISKCTQSHVANNVIEKKEKNETINFRNSCSVVLIRRHVLSFGFLWQANPCDKENGENGDNLNWYCNYKCVLPFTCSTSDRIVPCLFNVTSQWSNGNISSNLSGSYLSCNCLQLLDILVHSHLLASPWW